jgi:hypothetical protein
MAQHMIAPRWGGIYQYDESPTLPPDRYSVNFALQIQVDECGQISGWIHDGKYGIPEPAVMKGQVSLNQIRFKKTYRSLWFFSETGESCEIPEAGPHTIHYEGVLDSTATQMAGTWRIEPRSKVYIDGIEYNFPEVTGTWIARPSRLKLFDGGQ